MCGCQPKLCILYNILQHFGIYNVYKCIILDIYIYIVKATRNDKQLQQCTYIQQTVTKRYMICGAERIPRQYTTI